VLVVGLARARSAHRCGDDLVGLTLTGLTACLLSPISWTHHLYWVVPALLVLVDLAAGTATENRRRPGGTRAAAGIGAGVVFVVFASSVVWYFTTPAGGMRGSGPVALLGADAYTLVMLGLLVALPTRRLLPAPRSDTRHSGVRKVMADSR